MQYLYSTFFRRADIYISYFTKELFTYFSTFCRRLYLLDLNFQFAFIVIFVLIFVVALLKFVTKYLTLNKVRLTAYSVEMFTF